MKLKVMKCHPNAVLPTYAYSTDSGMDLYAGYDILLYPRQPVAISTGLIIELPAGYEGQIRPKSGLAMSGLTVFNTPGTIDQGYRGELKVILINVTSVLWSIKVGTKIAQLVIAPVIQAEIEEVDNIDVLTSRGEGGFGSTGL